MTGLFKDLINNISSENTIIIVTHEPELFEEVTSKKFVLYEGKLNQMEEKS